MPEVPAQEILSLAKTSTGNQTERMATPEELYALKRIAEVESALAELARAENSSRADVAVASETPVQIALPEPEHSAIAIAETAAAIHTGTSIQNPSANKFSGELNLSEQKLATAEPGEAALPSEQTGNPAIATQAQENSEGMVGAILFGAMLPETISSIDGSKAVWEATRSARWFYFLMLTVCGLFTLCVATTTDPRLILDGQTIPIARLGNILPINAFYLIAPIFLVVLFVRFQFLLLRVWSSMAALPAVFPDGQTVEQGGPWYLMGVVRRHFRWLRGTKTPVSWLG